MVLITQFVEMNLKMIFNKSFRDTNYPTRRRGHKVAAFLICIRILLLLVYCQYSQYISGLVVAVFLCIKREDIT